MLRAILFDLGDTLINFEPLDTRAVFREAARHTYDLLADRQHPLPAFSRYCRSQSRAVRWSYLWAKLTGREFNSLDLLRRFCSRMRIPVDEPLLLDLAWTWYEPLTRYADIEEDLHATLAGLRSSGLKLAIVSNTFVPGAVLDRHLDLHALRETFPVRVYSSEVGYRKPDRRIFDLALRQLGVTPDEALFVGDLVKTDIIGAKRVGMRTALKLPWDGKRSHRLADHVIRRIAELPGIVAIC